MTERDTDRGKATEREIDRGRETGERETER